MASNARKAVLIACLAASNAAKSVMLLAEARAGQVIREMQDSGKLAGRGGANKTKEKAKSQDGTLLLDGLGITKNESSRMQKAATVLDADPAWFSRVAAESTDANKDLTQQAVIREGTRIKNEATGKKKVATPNGLYDCVVIDPPWPMQKIERELAELYGVSRNGDIDNVLNRIIRQECPGAAELLSAIENFASERMTTIEHGHSTALIDQIIDRLERIRDAMVASIDE